ncbi:protein C3orf33 [Octopus bimaculoides]|uniref:TNase-like domain-containing protein n=1 Tax=Octopus bimaculoides TaxID=37653 RepID=A0A0L8FJ09_OCTBM|nr:protein C3orf33 [Octopus bimaculoides]|eukprot:XP_014789377.1 PREDICTED: protein C3orf33-like [Octopus bimaculoides]
MPLNLPDKFPVKKVDIHNFIDSHITEIRTGIYCIGTFGVFLCLRSLRPFSKFSKVEEVPLKFIQKNVTLQGRVKKIEEKGKLLIDHEPIVRLLWHQDKPCLPIRLAFLSISPQSRLWLLKNVLDKHIWFQPVRISNGGLSIDCIVYTKGFLWRKVNINEKMVMTGTSKLEENINVSLNPKQTKYLENLIKFETQADKKGVGMWAREKQYTGLLKMLHYFFEKTKNGYKFLTSKVSQKQS